MNPIRVAILGCGLIGSRWDMPGEAAAGGPSLTHAAAFSRQADARIVAFCDADAGKAREAASHWDRGQAFGDARALFDAVPVDLAVVATHSTVRREVIHQALAAGVRTLVIEKPLATTLAEARQVARDLAAHGAVALVNYGRHWDPALAEVRQRIAAGALGRVQRLVGLYGKGLANNGSHMIDLVGLLLDARPVAVRSLGSPLRADEAAWSAGADPAIDAQVRYQDRQGNVAQLDLLATEAAAFSCFELRLIGSDAICEIRLGGRCIEWLPVVADPNFAGYRVPGARETLAVRPLQSMDRMAVEALALARRQIGVASCDARSALATAATVDALQRCSQQPNPSWVPIEE